jgi:hypothetical protein
MVNKTHILVKEPEISVRHLADYMAASERKRRSIISDCKYRPAARMIQHREATIVLSGFFVSGKTNAAELKERSEFIRNKLADDDYDIAVNEANAGYLERASQILGDIKLPNANLTAAPKWQPQKINGVKLRFSAHLLLDSKGKKNQNQRGALMFRYAKGTPLKPEVASYQSAAIFGILREISDKDAEEVDKPLCITVDGFTGVVYAADGKAASSYLNMKAALASIAERWPAIKPPQKAIL